jgi:hypothetical protein
MTDFEKALNVLVKGKVRFVIVGGYAIVAHGVSIVTRDLDICYERSRSNLELLATALAPFHPTLRGAPEGLPFILDAETLKRGMNFTLLTDFGDLDLLGEMTGVGGYEATITDANELKLFNLPILIASPDVLLRAKKAAGRKKDQMAIPELEALIELKNRTPKS